MKYDPALDGLRAIAVGAVVLYHVNATALPGGWGGVDVFFVLSGFLITSILEAEINATGTIDLLRFYVRRALRLAPALLLMLALLLLFGLVQPGRFADKAVAAGFAASYMMNWNRAFDWGPQWLLGHTWSLAMEEQFYLLWPALLLFMGRSRRLPLTLALTVAIIAWRCWLAFHGATPERTYNGFDTHADALLIGALMAFLPQPRSLRGYGVESAVALLALLGLFLFAPFASVLAQSLGLTVAALISVALIWCARGDGWLRRMLETRPLVYTGRISYGLYLWHYPFIVVAGRHLHGAWMIVPVIAAYLMAAASFHLVELRFQKMKNRFFAVPRAKRTEAPLRPASAVPASSVLPRRGDG